jgi:pyrroline-5-carboxylate reductase
MEQHVTTNIAFMMKSHHELARILEAKRYVTTHVSHVVRAMPDHPESFGSGEKAIALSLEVTQSIAAYLSSLGDLEEAMADNLELIIAELHVGEMPE